MMPLRAPNSQRKEVQSVQKGTRKIPARTLSKRGVGSTDDTPTSGLQPSRLARSAKANELSY